jgi:hypothetical protein
MLKRDGLEPADWETLAEQLDFLAGHQLCGDSGKDRDVHCLFLGGWQTSSVGTRLVCFQVKLAAVQLLLPPRFNFGQDFDAR